MYNVPSGWTDVVKKQVINSANVLIKNASNVLIADKLSLLNYQYRARNSWICKEYPSYEITFTILNWNTFAYRNDLVKGALISISYMLENLTTSDVRWYVVYDNKYDYQSGKMTIKAYSPLQALTSNASYIMGKTTTELISEIASKYISYGLSVGTNRNSYQTMRVPCKITDGELLQHIAITTNCCLRLNEKTITLTNYKEIISGYVFDTINILNKLNNSISDIASNVVVATYYNGEVGQLGTAEKRSINASAIFGITYYYQGDEEATNITIKTSGGTPITPSSISYYNDMVWARFSSSANTTYILTANGTKVNQETTQDANATTIQSVMVLDSEHADRIRQNASDYYNYKTIVDFECRIDPRVEPLDALYIENLANYIYVEEVVIQFNGGFKGNIKGRYKNDFSALAPYITSLSYTIGNFSFRINNPNPFPVNCYIEYGNGTIIDKGTINPNTYIIVNKSNTPDLANAFVDKFNGNLANDIICYFDESDSTIIVEKD